MSFHSRFDSDQKFRIAVAGLAILAVLIMFMLAIPASNSVAVTTVFQSVS